MVQSSNEKTVTILGPANKGLNFQYPRSWLLWRYNVPRDALDEADLDFRIERNFPSTEAIIFSSMNSLGQKIFPFPNHFFIELENLKGDYFLAGSFFFHWKASITIK